MTFARDISTCAWVAGGSSTFALTAQSGSNEVTVQTKNPNGQAADDTFTVIVSCPPSN